MSIRNDKSLEVINIPRAQYIINPSDEWEYTYNISGDKWLYLLEADSNSDGAPSKAKTKAKLDLTTGAIVPMDQVLVSKDLEVTPLAQSQNLGIDRSTQGSPPDETIHPTSSLEKHERHLGLRGPLLNKALEEATLSMDDIQRQRVKAGYLFDAELNIDVVRDDPWLVGFWEVIKRLGDMARNSGMVHETLDLSYLGVQNIWNEELGPHPRRRLPSQLQKVSINAQL